MGKKKRGKAKRKGECKRKGGRKNKGGRKGGHKGSHKGGHKGGHKGDHKGDHRGGSKEDLLWRLYAANFYGSLLYGEQDKDAHNLLHRVYAYLPLLGEACSTVWIRRQFVAVFETCVRKWCTKEQLLLKWYCLCCSKKGIFKYNSSRSARMFYQKFMLPMAKSNMMVLLKKLHRHQLPVHALYEEKDSPFRYLVHGDVQRPLLACAQHLQAQWMLKHLQQDPDNDSGDEETEKAYSTEGWKYKILFWWKHAANNGCVSAEQAVRTHREKWGFVCKKNNSKQKVERTNTTNFNS